MAMVVGVGLGSATGAHAKPAVLVLGLDAPGFPERTTTKLDAAMRAEVKASTHRKYKMLPKPTLPFGQMKLAVGCIDNGPECLGLIGTTLGAELVLQTALRGNPNKARLSFTLVTAQSGHVDRRSAEMEQIAPDSDEELRVHVAALFGVKRKPPPGKLVLYVASDIGKLEGADILLDDKLVTRESLVKIAAGRHRLSIRQQGFETFVWIGNVRPGRTTRVPVKFVPTGQLAVKKQSEVTPPVVARMPEPEPEPDPEPAPVDEVAAPTVETPAPEVDDGGGPRIITWIFGGVTLAAVGVGAAHGVFVLQGQGDLHDQLEALKLECSAIESCRTSTREDKLCLTRTGHEICEAGDRDAAIATAGWITAGVLAAGTVLAFFLEDSGGPAVTGGVAPTDGGAAAALHVRF